MSWFWLNVPAAAVFFAAWSGIPLYMVLKHPTWGAEPADSDERAIVKPAGAAEATAMAQLDDALQSGSLVESAR
jgi:hypothetical protein